MFANSPTLVTLALPVLASALSLIDTLKANGASQFASLIENNSTFATLYASPNVRTVYAVPDVYFQNSALLNRQNGKKARNLLIQASNDITGLDDMSNTPGAAFPVNEPGQDGLPQNFVAQTGVNETNTPQKRQNLNGTQPKVPISIASGLGQEVTVTQGDIHYDEGIIHFVNGFFTEPEPLSTTISTNGQTTLQSLLTQGNLSETFDGHSSLTIFTPSNEAFAASNASTQDPAALQRLLKNHVIPGFKGYLPLLKDGDTFVTLSGDSLTVRVIDNGFYINGAKIISSNSITSNGVAHVVNKVITPVSTPIPYTGAAVSVSPGIITAAVLVMVALYPSL